MGKCYITQHEFQKANSVLLKAKVLGDKMDETNKMLFDVKMEIGEYAEAEKYLNSIENKSSFDHLIRRSKWEDHLGNLDRAIVFMESAVKQAELKKNDELMKWSYTNLADFYGHAGKISDSYDYYLKTLKIDKTNAYALKGIAWILYSHEKNIEGAEQILTALKKWHSSPDYLILQSELAEYNEDVVQKNRWINKYFEQINKPENGKMYNKYKIKLLAEEKKEYTKSQQIADQEIILRPTPQSYCALAWTKFLAGNEKEALKIVEAKVAGKSLEPELLYQIAEIYKANDQIEKVANLKQELFESVFELGPVTEKKIMAL
jgi:Tfp pilus assembly protein PilF